MSSREEGLCLCMYMPVCVHAPHLCPTRSPTLAPSLLYPSSTRAPPLPYLLPNRCPTLALPISQRSPALACAGWRGRSQRVRHG
jgi:hypothetical protein